MTKYINAEVHDGQEVRRVDEVVLAFLRLPIEDPYLESQRATLGKVSEELPFAKSSTSLRTCPAWDGWFFPSSLPVPAREAGGLCALQLSHTRCLSLLGRPSPRKSADGHPLLDCLGAE